MNLKWSIGLAVLVLSLSSLSASVTAQPNLIDIAGKIVRVPPPLPGDPEPATLDD